MFRCQTPRSVRASCTGTGGSFCARPMAQTFRRGVKPARSRASDRARAVRRTQREHARVQPRTRGCDQPGHRLTAQDALPRTCARRPGAHREPRTFTLRRGGLGVKRRAPVHALGLPGAKTRRGYVQAWATSDDLGDDVAARIMRGADQAGTPAHSLAVGPSRSSRNERPLGNTLTK